MEIELIGSTVGAVFFGIGVQIIFYTGKFEMEYSNKIDVIKTIIKKKLEDELDKFFKLKYTNHFIGNINNKKSSNKWKKVSEDVFKTDLTVSDIEPVNPFDLNEIVEISNEYEDWANFLVESKSRLRRIGLCIIAFGVAIIAPSVYYGFIDPNNFLSATEYQNAIDSLIVFTFFVWFIIGMFLFQQGSEHGKILKMIDERYMKVKENIDI